jgi:hypothetical protein
VAVAARGHATLALADADGTLIAEPADEAAQMLERMHGADIIDVPRGDPVTAPVLVDGEQVGTFALRFPSSHLPPPAPFLPEEWHGRPIVGLVVCHSGPDPEADLCPIRALGDPIADIVTDKPYTDQQPMLDGNEPKGQHYYWKTEYLAGLSDGFLATFRDRALRVTSPLSESIIIHLAGAINERADDDGAVGNRDGPPLADLVEQPGVIAGAHHRCGSDGELRRREDIHRRVGHRRGPARHVPAACRGQRAVQHRDK